jgi:MFS transporter, DHA1 family, tetracycline resistance protein
MLKARNQLVFIFITVFIDCVGIRLVYPVAASIVAEVGHVSVTEAITYSGWMMAAYAAMQFIFSPILGALSDKYGRRPILLISMMGLGIDYLFLALANTLPLLFLGRIIAGICGARFTTSFAYIADISAAEKRAQYFGIIGVAIGLGFTLGPFLGGLLSEMGTRVPFVAAAILTLLNWLYGFFILPESLKPENRRAFSLRRANPLGAFEHLRKNKALRMLFVVLFFLFLAGQVMPSVWPFYTKFVFKWSDLKIGYSLAFVGVVLAIVKGGLIKWSQNRFGDVRTVYIGLIFYMVGLSLFAFASQPWMLYAFSLVYCIGGIAPPSLQAIISGKMQANEQGELQGVITSLLSLANIISPLIMTNLFYFFTKENTNYYFPGASFAAAAILILIAFSIYLGEIKRKAI